MLYYTTKVILVALFLVHTAPGGRCEEQMLDFRRRTNLDTQLKAYSGISRAGEAQSKIKFSSSGGWFEWTSDLPPALYDATVRRNQPKNDPLVPMTLKIDGQRVATFDTVIEPGELRNEHMNIEITSQGSKTLRLEALEDGPEIDLIYMESISAVASLEDPWYLVRTGVEMTFEEDIDSEMTISFEVHSDLDPDISTFETQVLDWECDAVADFVSASELVEATGVTASDPALRVRHLYLNFDETNFYKSNAWEGDESEGDIKVCVQQEIHYVSPDGEETHSMSMVRTQISQHVKMVGAFATEEDTTTGMKPINAAVVKNRDFESDATFDFDVDICICDESRECLVPQPEAKMNSFMDFCITAASSIVEIAEVTTFVLEQEYADGTVFTYHGIDDSGEPRDGITYVDYEDDPKAGSFAVVTQHMFTSFFDQKDPNPVEIGGEVNLRLREGRRHRLLRARMMFEKNEVEDHAMKGAFRETVELEDSADAAVGPSNMLVVCVFATLISLVVIV